MLKKGDKYVILSFDTESDIGSWTQNYTSIDRAIPKLLNMMRERKIKATFLWECMAAQYNPMMVKRVFDEGHEVGIHSYNHESLGDPGYFIPCDRPILPEEIPNRLARTVKYLESITKTRPVSSRAPRLWGNKSMLKALEELGLYVDSTFSFSSKNRNLFPYHPDPTEPTKEGNMKLLEIPVGGAAGDMMKHLSPKVKSMIDRHTPGVDCVGQWPILRLCGAEEFTNFFKPYIEAQIAERGYSVVCIYLHPWEFIPMPSIIESIEARSELSFTLYENCGDYALKALDEFIGIMHTKGYKFVTLKRMYELWYST